MPRALGSFLVAVPESGAEDPADEPLPSMAVRPATTLIGDGDAMRELGQLVARAADGVGTVLYYKRKEYGLS